MMTNPKNVYYLPKTQSKLLKSTIATSRRMHANIHSNSTASKLIYEREKGQIRVKVKRHEGTFAKQRDASLSPRTFRQQLPRIN